MAGLSWVSTETGKSNNCTLDPSALLLASSPLLTHTHTNTHSHTSNLIWESEPPWRYSSIFPWGLEKRGRGEEPGEEEVNNFILHWPGDDKIDCLALVASSYHTHTHAHTHAGRNTLYTQIIAVCHPRSYILSLSLSHMFGKSRTTYWNFMIVRDDERNCGPEGKDWESRRQRSEKERGGRDWRKILGGTTGKP